MLTYVILSSVLATQRPGGNPAPNPTASVTKATTTKLTTTGQIRMTAPETLARLLSLGGPSANFVRSFEKTRVQTKPVLQTRAPKRADFKVPAQGQIDEKRKKTDPIYVATYYGGFFELFPKQESNFDAAYGDVAQGSEAPIGHYDGVAPRDGTITITKPKGGPFAIFDAKTFTGYWNGSEPQVDKLVTASGGDVKIPVKAGQEYTIRYKFDSKALQPGAYVAKSDIDDGNLIHMNLSANVVPPYGGINMSVLSHSDYVATGQSIKIPISLSVNGNTPSTDIKFEVLNAASLKDAGIAVTCPTVNVKNGATTSANLNVYGYEAPDSQQTLQIKFSGFKGNASAVVNIPISIRTVWIDSGPINVVAGNVSLWARMKMNSLGYYECTSNVSTTSKLLGDSANWFIFAENPVDGKRLSTMGMRYIHAKYEIGPSSFDDASSGISTLVKNNFAKLQGTGVRVVLQVNDSLSNFTKVESDWNLVNAFTGLPFP